ncbi:hypothetical protein [Paenibacillus aceti]|uniref:BRCT domain-containing protein n=1 Tax=Paenibacillus aceti TaxID=1820010 RepID=A0ABQ1VQD9_9BACL|nr:hypothetical protein [Paenibacillus aceti]GGF86723.1 hypothetical protein GCM10010913_05280 [Paenibacillus aceti]
MYKQLRLIDADWLLECLKKEAEFCIKEKFNEKNTRFYLGRETVLTDIIRQIESGKFDVDPITLPTIKPGDKAIHSDLGRVRIMSEPMVTALKDKDEYEVYLSDLEVSHD